MTYRDASSTDRPRAFPHLRLLQLFLAVLGGLYLLQSYSPLRLNTDAIFYLSRAASLVDGTDFVYPNDRRPLGYSYLLAGLDQVGLGVSWAFVLLNCVFVGIAVATSYALWRRHFALSRRTATLLSCLLLLSFGLIKYAAFPIADMAFFGVVPLCLLVLSEVAAARTPRPWLLLAAALALIIWSITIRTIGVALLPALAWVAWQVFRSGRPLTRHHLLLLSLGAGVLLVVAVLFVTRTGYIDELRNLHATYGLANNVSYMASSRLREWGELLVNVPMSRAPGFAKPLIPVLGIVAILTVLAGFYLKRNRWDPGAVFFFASVLILLIYPGNDIRYWLPVLPLLMGWTATLIRAGTRFRLVRLAAAGYVAWFVIAGMGAVFYSSRITFAGDAFPDRFGDGSLRRTYEIAFDGGQIPPDVEKKEVNRVGLDLLFRYEPRLRTYHR